MYTPTCSIYMYIRRGQQTHSSKPNKYVHFCLAKYMHAFAHKFRVPTHTIRVQHACKTHVRYTCTLHLTSTAHVYTYIQFFIRVNVHVHELAAVYYTYMTTTAIPPVPEPWLSLPPPATISNSSTTIPPLSADTVNFLTGWMKLSPTTS